MNGIELQGWQDLAALAVTVGFSTLRLAVALIVVPLFANEVIPALVRNSLFASLGLIVAVVQPVETLLTASALTLLLLVAKEALIGVSIGILFGVFLWAFEAAGELIDTQVGSAQAQIYDPIAGHEVTVYGDFMARLANLAFLGAGGLTLMVGLLLDSYVIWPIGSILPSLERAGALVFADAFSGVFTLALLVAAPILALLFLIDMTMGLVNRYAERLNVFFLSNSIKSLVAVFLVLLMLPLVTRQIGDLIERNAIGVEQMLSPLFVQGDGP